MQALGGHPVGDRGDEVQTLWGCGGLGEGKEEGGQSEDDEVGGRPLPGARWSVGGNLKLGRPGSCPGS